MDSLYATGILILIVGGIFLLGFAVGMYVGYPFRPEKKKSIKARYVERLEKENKDLRFQMHLFMRHDD
jgi:hypothetical protein